MLFQFQNETQSDEYGNLKRIKKAATYIPILGKQKG